jgi:putative heme-binding domain-containing protein
LKSLSSILVQLPDRKAALGLWRELFQNRPFLDLFVKDLPKDLPADAYGAALEVAKGMGGGGKKLVELLSPLAGASTAVRDFAAEIAGMVDAVKKESNPAEGELIYRRTGCAVCHAIGGAGGNFGPDFSSIGASAPLDYIIESTINPAAKVKEGYHGFSYTMKDGSVMTGIPVRETTTEVIIRPAPGAELPVLKANIVKKENIGSLMPMGFADALDAQSKSNLYAFLSQIGRPGPFDTSIHNVARLWNFHSNAPGPQAATEATVAVMTLVNGNLRTEDRPDKPYATATFNAAKPTTKPLILTGIEAAWLDGKPLTLKDGQCTTIIPAGDHQLTVQPAKDATIIKAQCDDATFLTNP